MGSVIGLAAIAVAIDHTRHKVPEAVPATEEHPQQDAAGAALEEGASPCGLGASPCGLGENPCGLGASPCGL